MSRTTRSFMVYRSWLNYTDVESVYCDEPLSVEEGMDALTFGIQLDERKSMLLGGNQCLIVTQLCEAR